MATFNKILILNKEFQEHTAKSGRKVQTFQVVKNLKYNTSATTSSASFLLISTAELTKTFITNPSSLTILPVQQERQQVVRTFHFAGVRRSLTLNNIFPQLPSIPTSSCPSSRANVEDILPRAVKLFMINFYFKPEYKLLNRVELLQIAETIQINLTSDDRKESWYCE